ncbi:MAG: hypothetical protein GXP55_19185 [Deltaproteobacteria bacterium]|nr:hypothetical protein [Deltaproteobacteria bacterium]
MRDSPTAEDLEAHERRSGGPRRASAWVRVSTLAALVALLAAASVAGGQRDTIGVDEIHPGMRGYGLSVFRGEVPERFDVEVIDVLHGFRPNQDLILIRTPHPVLNQAITVGGMSGSPIYLDGRLAGAYAYGWPFGIEPVIGVTPIANMLAEGRRPTRDGAFPGATPLSTRPPTRRRPRPRRPRVSYDGGPVDPLAALRQEVARLGFRAPAGRRDLSRAVPVATPLMLGGFTDEAARLLDAQLSPLGLDSAQAGGSGTHAGAHGPARFVNGGVIGVSLMRGDMDATAIGTVTHVLGRRLVAFGHPMMNAGQVGLPTTTARVLHILRSQNRSFKIAEAEVPLGTLIHDRPSAIVVDSGLRAATLPLRIRVHGVEDAPKTEWNVELASQRNLTPALALAALTNALSATASDRTDLGYRAVTRVELSGRAPVVLEDSGVMHNGPVEARALISIRLFRVLAAAYDNSFEDVHVRRAQVDLYLDYGHALTQIVGASVPSEEVDPGSVVPVRVTLRRYGEAATTRVVSLTIPRRAAGETLELTLRPGDEVTPDRPTPRSLADVLDNIANAYPATSLVLSLKMPSRGLRFRGHVVTALPRSALDTLTTSASTGPSRPFITYERSLVPLGQVLTGSATLRLRVRATPRQHP